MQTPYTFAQQAELQALICALLHFAKEPVNIYGDSAYTVGVTMHIETATIGHSQSEELFHLFHTLQKVIQVDDYTCSIGHIRAHSKLPDPLTSVNAKVNHLVAANQQLSPYDCAQASHSLHHRNASSLHKKFHITQEQALQIVLWCPHCVVYTPASSTGVNPDGVFGQTNCGRWM